jgi:hypothetical protein
MGKSFLALLLVAFGVGGTDTMDPTITIDPHPPVAGQSVTVTFTGTCPATLTMEINPGGIFSEIHIGEDGTATFTMPDGDSYIISDEKGEADPLSGSITP